MKSLQEVDCVRLAVDEPDTGFVVATLFRSKVTGGHAVELRFEDQVNGSTFIGIIGGGDLNRLGHLFAEAVGR